MKMAKLLDGAVSGLIRVVLFALLVQPLGAVTSLEQTFAMLQIGTTTYRNVTVTTKSKSYIFILHSQGMTNIKVADLPPDVRLSLGYDDPAVPQVKTNTASAWAKQTLAKMETPQVTRFRDQLTDSLHSRALIEKLQLPQLNRNALIIGAIALAALYLFHSYCCFLICKKIGLEPGKLVWLPLLQIIPLLKAASMSFWWFIVFLVPGLNLVALVALCWKLTQARGKTFLVALLLIFPLSSPFAALYLAFSGGRTRPKRNERRVAIMTLETA
jgi:hypothetical protein